ncbi:helix-turn-helix transcriptional regulator [Curvibacter gracilis]|uniref:helix-turn-helix transcriptional regulator n=1 Tax=Curvibacter gracilis TaxID=230310 RepID=UPI0004B322A8|nr:AraC family transcriptional regulator [Curvibacter gracilis]
MFELCGQAHCTVAAVARQCGLSRGHFSMAFKAWTGYSPAQWRLARKIDLAKLLLKGPLSIADIAIECGFADQAHLTRSFRAAEGLSPGQWRSQFRAH